MKLTPKEIEILKTIVEIDLKMIQFVKGFKKSKTVHETNLEKILEKLKQKEVVPVDIDLPRNGYGM